MVLQDICTPALIYLIFSITQIVIDTVHGKYNMAFIKLWVSLIFTILLNFLCTSGLGIVSWLIVFIPFMLMTVIVSLLLLMFGLDPLTGRRPRVINRHHRHHNRYSGRRNNLDYLQSGDMENKKYKRHHHHKFNSEYDESDMSQSQQDVLNDIVRARTNLSKDPLQ